MVYFKDFKLNLTANEAGNLKSILTDEQLRDMIEKQYNIIVPMGYFIIRKEEGDSWERVYSIKTTGKYRILFQRHKEFGEAGISGELLVYVKGA